MGLEFQLLDLHTTSITLLHRHTLLVLHRSSPIVNVLATANRVSKLSRSRAGGRGGLLSANGLGPGLSLEVVELVPELGLLAPLLVGLALGELGVELLGGAPFRGEGVLFDLHPEEQHHVVPVRLVRVRSGEVGEEIGVFEFLVGEEVVLFTFRLCEERVFVGQLVLAGVADLDTKDLVPDKVDFVRGAVGALLAHGGVGEDAEARLKGSRFLPAEFLEELEAFPFLRGHAFRFLFLGRAARFCFGDEGRVVRVVFCGEEAAFCIRHGGHVVVDEFGKVARRARGGVCVAGIAVR